MLGASAPATVTALIAANADAHPESTYLVATSTGATLTFAGLAAASRRVAALIEREGAAPGAHVALVMPNGLAGVRILLGAMAGGYCVTPVNLLAQPEQMRYVLEHSDSALVFAAPEWAPRVSELVKGFARPVRVIEVDPDAESLPGERAADAQVLRTPVQPQKMALLMYTSGTTGQPKGVMLSHGNLVANALAISKEHSLGAKDRVAAVLPLYHINAFAVTMLAPLAHGGSLALLPKFSSATFWATVTQFGCTWINVVPTIVSYLLEGGSPPREALAHIRFCRCASAALAPEHHRAFESKFGIGIIETMGLTETVAPAFSNPLDPAARRIGSVGRPAGCEARVADKNGNALPDGEPGEILIRGPQVTAGYYKNPEATAGAFFPGGWLRTGDIGVRDADGFYFITGRIKELIIKGGENIAPREIDEVLLRHPAVLEAAAVGVPDRHYGQEIVACVVRREEIACTEEELRAFCGEHLGRFKTPKAIHFVTEMPRGPSGKVQRLKLPDILPK